MLFLSLLRYYFGIHNVKTVSILNYVYAHDLPSRSGEIYARKHL